MLDVLVRGGRVIDGAGNPWFRGDVGIRGDRVVAVGQVDEPARRVIEADGRVVCPGFTDMHTHSDVQLLAHPEHAMKVHQGVTLDVVGQDGLGLAPVDAPTLETLRTLLVGWNGDEPGIGWDWTGVADYLARFDDRVAINAVALVGHGTLRLRVMGADDRAPTPAEFSTRCARCSPRASPRAPRASPPGSRTRPACTRRTTSSSSSAR